MAIEIKNNTVIGAEKFLVTPSDAPVTADGNNIRSVETVFDIREPASLLGKLGLPADTPIPELIDLLRTLREKPENAEQTARNGLSKYLGASANWAQIGSFLLQIAQTIKL